MGTEGEVVGRRRHDQQVEAWGVRGDLAGAELGVMHESQVRGVDRVEGCALVEWLDGGDESVEAPSVVVDEVDGRAGGVSEECVQGGQADAAGAADEGGDGAGARAGEGGVVQGYVGEGDHAGRFDI